MRPGGSGSLIARTRGSCRTGRPGSSRRTGTGAPAAVGGGGIGARCGGTSCGPGRWGRVARWWPVRGPRAARASRLPDAVTDEQLVRLKGRALLAGRQGQEPVCLAAAVVVEVARLIVGREGQTVEQPQG